MATLAEKRREFDELLRSGILEKECGTKCVSCGSPEDIVYIHVVPLESIGTNRLTNIKPVCGKCMEKLRTAVGVWNCE